VLRSDSLAGAEVFGQGVRSWVGPRGPELFPGNEVLLGETTRYVFDSPALGERREVHVDEAPRARSEPLPVVDLTDGQSSDGDVGALDRPIEQGRLAPLVLVGVHSNG
jgi:enterochelin esterase-like enzyme